MHILVTRPETEAPRTTRKLEAMGHRVTLCPLLEIVLQAPPLDLTGVDALILTSRNAVRALAAHPQTGDLLSLPVIAVGKSTAEAARERGFAVELEGDGSGTELAELIVGRARRQTGTLLHISGATIAFDLAAALARHGIPVSRAVVYCSRPIARLPDTVASNLRSGALDAVLLMSPRTAGAWCHVTQSAGLSAEAAALTHVCLSAGVAAALRPLGPRRVEIAVKPNEEQMLALLARLSSSSADST